MEKLVKRKQVNQRFNQLQLQKLRINRDMQYMLQYKKQGTSIIVATIPPGKQNIEKALDLCQQKNVNARNIKERTNRDSVKQITAKMIKYLEGLNNKAFDQSNGLLLYVGVFGKSEQVLVIDLPIPEKITQFTYSCDTALDTRPIEQLTRSKATAIFAIVDGHGIRVWSDVQGVQTKEYQEDYFVVRFQNHGGQSQNRFLHTAQNNKHQQVTNSISRLLKVIRDRNMTFDSMFICGNQEFRSEVIQGFRDSDLASRVLKVHDIPVGVDSTNVKTIHELKMNISNISELIKDDTMYAESQYTKQLEDFLSVGDCSIQFGIDDLLDALSASNVTRIAINEDCEMQVTQQQLAQAGLSIMEDAFRDRDQIALVDMLLFMTSDPANDFELVILQSENAKHLIGQFGGFYLVNKY